MYICIIVEKFCFVRKYGMYIHRYRHNNPHIYISASSDDSTVQEFVYPFLVSYWPTPLLVQGVRGTYGCRYIYEYSTEYIYT